MGTWAKRLTGLGLLYGVPILLYCVFRYVILGILPGHNATQNMDQWFMGNIATFGATFWLVMIFWFIFSGVICVAAGFEYGDYRTESVDTTGNTVTGLVCAVLAILSIVFTIVISVNNDKDFARYYAKSVTFYAPDTSNLPQSLSLLSKGGHKSSDSCAVVSSSSDVPNCIKQGSLNQDGWDARVSSLDGAIYGLTHSAAFKQHVSLDKTTMKYLNAWHGQPARWSGVLNGSGKSVPMGGVAEWDGHKVVQQCDFDGKYEINRAFSGSGMNDMDDLLAEKYSGYTYDTSDVWGYCNGAEPVVIVPMTEQIGYASRTVSAPAGFVVIKGSPKGDPQFTFKKSAQPGEYPGPVYPSSMVDHQLSASEWAAGRKNQDQNGFGYEPATSAAQAGNVSDYLLRDKVTGRLEWVTPLTLRGSSSQLFVAYAVSYADQLNGGSLNPLSIYVLGANDPRQINVENLESSARNYLASVEPGFAGQGGKLLEFTPVGGNIWRAYGEINGQVEYLLDIDATNVSSSVLTNIGGSADTSGGSTNTNSGNASCGQPLTGLSNAQIATCLKQLADELASRQGSTTTPSK